MSGNAVIVQRNSRWAVGIGAGTIPGTVPGYVVTGAGCRAEDITSGFRGVCKRVLKLRIHEGRFFGERSCRRQPDSGNPTVRDEKRAEQKRELWGTGNPPHIPKGCEPETLLLKLRALSFYSTLHTGKTACCKPILELNKREAAEKNPNILQQLETQIAATDRQIDRLVYELYGLTEAEVAIVDPAFVPMIGTTAGKGGGNENNLHAILRGGLYAASLKGLITLET